MSNGKLKVSLLFIKKIMTVIEEWNRLKRDKNKTSKVAEKARKDFMKKGKTVFWIGRKNMREILKKRTMDKEYLKADLEFLRDQRTKRKMSLGSKDRAYCKRIEKRDERKKRSLELPGRSNNNTDILSEIEFSSDTSNMNTSLDSESFDITHWPKYQNQHQYSVRVARAS